MKKIFCKYLLVILTVGNIFANDFTDLLQDLAVQTACLGMYSTAQTGAYVTSRYDDPPDWYDPPMMANRFAAMSGNMTRINTFYGVCFDYAQFAWDDIKKYQKMYNDAGMKNQQWFIAVANKNAPSTIILYDPVSQEKATIISNGVYLKENSRHKVYSHDGATGHAWIWIQHKNGDWYWIDPTWTDNTGYVWWGIVKDDKEVQYYPDTSYCVASNYPKPGESNRKARSPSSTYTNTNPPTYNYSDSYFFAGYNYANGLPLGITVGDGFLYGSLNIGGRDKDDPNVLEGIEAEWILGLSIPILDFLMIPIGVGANHSGPDDNRRHRFVMEIGLQPVIGFLYLSATYRLIGFKQSGFTLGAGIVFK
jgi:hypothetical protein